MNKPLRLAIVGAGLRSTILTETVLMHAPWITICGIADRVQARAELYRDRFGLLDVPCHADPGRMLDETAPDAVAIFTPDDQHVEPACMALKRGIHVYCEKPLATTLADCDTIIEAARHTTAVFYMGFNLRHMPLIRTARELIADGEIGEILTLEMNEHYAGGRTYFRRWNRLLARSGGLWVTKATHDFDAMRWMVGREPESLYAIGGRRYLAATPPGAARCSECDRVFECPEYQPPGTLGWDERSDDPRVVAYWQRWQELGADSGYLPLDACLFGSQTDTIEHGMASVRFAGDVCATYTLNVIAPGGSSGRWLRASGTQGALLVDPASQTVVVYNRNGKPKRTYDVSDLSTGSHGGGDRAIMWDFASACRTGKKPEASWADGRAAVVMGLAATRSMASGQAIKFSEMHAGA